VGGMEVGPGWQWECGEWAVRGMEVGLNLGGGSLGEATALG